MKAQCVPRKRTETCQESVRRERQGGPRDRGGRLLNLENSKSKKEKKRGIGCRSRKRKKKVRNMQCGSVGRGCSWEKEPLCNCRQPWQIRATESNGEIVT